MNSPGGEQTEPVSKKRDAVDRQNNPLPEKMTMEQHDLQVETTR